MRVVVVPARIVMYYQEMVHNRSIGREGEKPIHEVN